MNDDVKAAIERFHEWEFDGLDARDHKALLAHIDGEPARLTAAREEQREACAEYAFNRHAAFGWDERECASLANAVRGTFLTATPLADENATLRARVAELEAKLWATESERDRAKELGAEQRDYWTRAHAEAVAEREALRAAVATADEAVRYWTEQAQHGANEAAALRAQVEAARAAMRDLLNDDDCGRHAYAPILSARQRASLLRAMDEAKGD